MDDIALGIDLGTSTSCVAVVQNERPVPLPNESGEVIHASVVTFTPDNKVVVGNAAKKLLTKYPERTIYSAKRLIGRYFFSEEVKKAVERSSYKIVEGPTNAVRIAVGDQSYAVPEISAIVLKEMKRIAEKALGREVKQAVITVPAYFNDNQRQATRDAGRIAGLDVIRMINEPTAAALSYGYGRDLVQKVAVYDLGGGTFDVSILEIGKDVFEVLATAGDTYLGGDDFDQRILNYLLQCFQKQHGRDIRDDRSALAVLRDAAEWGKKQLSTQAEVEFDLIQVYTDAKGRSYDLEAKMSQAEFQKLSADLIQRTFKVCDEALQSARLTVNDLDGVIVVGGPTRLPMIRNAVQQYFGKPPKADVDPDQVVAMGAALQGYALLHAGPQTMLLDVTPLTLRLATVGGFTEEIIAKNTPVPIERARTFTTVRDNQDRVRIRILQGESRKESECTTLGDFEFGGLRPAPRGQVRVEVSFEIDANGIVHVSAHDVETGRRATTTIHLSSGLSDADIEKSRQRNEETAITLVPLT